MRPALPECAPGQRLGDLKPAKSLQVQTGAHTPSTAAERKASSMLPVSQQTQMTQAEQQHIQFRVDIAHGVASQHRFSAFRHPDRPGELGRLLRLDPGLDQNAHRASVTPSASSSSSSETNCPDGACLSPVTANRNAHPKMGLLTQRHAQGGAPNQLALIAATALAHGLSLLTLDADLSALLASASGRPANE